MKYLTIVVISIIAIAVIGGLWTVGSPAKERLRRFDAARVSHLQTIQSEVLNYWQAKGSIPEDLSVLKDDIRGLTIPKDPATQVPYEYFKKGDLNFELCAKFALMSVDDDKFNSFTKEPDYDQSWAFGKLNDNWKHTSGRACFERTIDKDLYKTQKEPMTGLGT